MTSNQLPETVAQLVKQARRGEESAVGELRELLKPIFKQLVRSSLRGGSLVSLTTLISQHEDLFREAIQFGLTDRVESVAELLCGRCIHQLVTANQPPEISNLTTQLLNAEQTQPGSRENTQENG